MIPKPPLSNWLGHRLLARQSPHTTDWRHVGTVESAENGPWPNLKLTTLRVALRDGGEVFLRGIDGGHCVPDLVAPNLLRMDADLVQFSPSFKLVPTDNFCLDEPMGPGVGDYHGRPTQVIESHR